MYSRSRLHSPLWSRCRRAKTPKDVNPGTGKRWSPSSRNPQIGAPTAFLHLFCSFAGWCTTDALITSLAAGYKNVGSESEGKKPRVAHFRPVFDSFCVPLIWFWECFPCWVTFLVRLPTGDQFNFTGSSSSGDHAHTVYCLQTCTPASRCVCGKGYPTSLLTYI